MLCGPRQEEPAGADPPPGKACCKRSGPGSRAPTTTSTGNGGWWRSIDWLGWSSWASGRPVTSDGSKTKFQLYLAATVANLTLLANQIGVFGDPGDDSDTIATNAEIGGNLGVGRHLLPTWMLAWLRSPILALSLSPTRAFRPAF